MSPMINLPVVVVRRLVHPSGRDPFRAAHLVVSAAGVASGLAVVAVVTPEGSLPLAITVLVLVAAALACLPLWHLPKRLAAQRRAEQTFFDSVGRPGRTRSFRAAQRAIADVPTWAVIAGACLLAIPARTTPVVLGGCAAACAAGLLAAEAMLVVAASSTSRAGLPMPVAPGRETPGVEGGHP